MVYCTKCGTENPDDAVNCSKCGAPLNPPYRYYRRYRAEEGMYCFGGRSHVWGIIIGLFMVMIGISSLLGGNIWDKVWPMFIILIGAIIVVNAVTRR